VRSKELRHAIALEQDLARRMDTAPNPAAAREDVHAAVMARVGKTVPDDVDVELVDEGAVRGEWVASPLEPEARVALFLHGGAGVFGCAAESRELAARISRSAQARVLAVDYRLAPEDPFPAALDDAVAAFRWLVADGADPREIALVGESTGAALALGAALRLRDEGDALPGTVALLSPVTDFTTIGHPGADDPTGAGGLIARNAGLYLGDTPANDPRVSPALADLAGSPALLIQVGTADPALEQVRGLLERARAAGVEVSHYEWDGMIHRWQSYPHIYESVPASNQVGEYLLQRLGPGYVPVPRAA
jgi:epsilon-lactone hydrolase